VSMYARGMTVREIQGHLPAVSSLGGFRTPAPAPRLHRRKGPASKTLHQSTRSRSAVSTGGKGEKAVLGRRPSEASIAGSGLASGRIHLFSWAAVAQWAAGSPCGRLAHVPVFQSHTIGLTGCRLRPSS
jgi:hypothetical protein